MRVGHLMAADLRVQRHRCHLRDRSHRPGRRFLENLDPESQLRAGQLRDSIDHLENVQRRALVVGHSQGGLSSLGVAQLEAGIRDPNFLGTVSLAGASDLEDGIDAVERANLPPLNGLLAFWVFGVKTLYPQADLKDILSSKALAIYNQSIEDGCSAASGAFATLPTHQMFVPGWRDNPYIKQFLARNRPGAQPTYGPLLLVGGGSDILFTESAGDKIAQRYCRAGARIQRNVYPGLGHDALVYGSLRDQLDWIAARFAGTPAPSNCNSR